MRTHYYGPRERSKIHHIPIYGVWFEVILSGSIEKSRNCHKRAKALGGICEDLVNVTGLHAYNGPLFCVFLQFDELYHNTIAHEVFHATHRIMERVSATIAPECHEPHAHLMGHLTQLVYEDIKRWGYRAK